MLGHDAARAEGGRWLLRMEDLDAGRVRAEYHDGIEDDLRWLGLGWDGPVLRQSERAAAYEAALGALRARGLLYPCICTRRDLAAAAPQEGDAAAPYPGTCRALSEAEAAASGRPYAWRLAPEGVVLDGLGFEEVGAGRVAVDPAVLARLGDPVLWRKEGLAAYHLAVVVDDAHQAVTRVTRGADLRAATHLHVLLQALLGLETPAYRHHRLIRDEAGKRLAKRDDARALATLRAQGATPGDIRRMVSL